MYNDIDFVGLRKQSAPNRETVHGDGIQAAERCSTRLQGESRLMFMNQQNGRAGLTSILDKFIMCHEFDLEGQIGAYRKYLPPADLLLTKSPRLSRSTRRTFMDAVALLVDYSGFGQAFRN